MKCPGQDSRYWKPGAIFETACPHCGHQIEFFKDDVSRICKQCNRRLLNPGMDFGCASYCKYAEQCLGNLPPEVVAQRESLLKDRVAIEVKRHFGRDFKRIGHATRTARYAEEIGKGEGENLAVLLAAAYLYGLSKGETDAVDQAGEILRRAGANEELADEVLRILRGKVEEESDPVLRILHDADRIAELEAAAKEEGEGDPGVDSGETFLTPSGRTLAKKVLSPRALR